MDKNNNFGSLIKFEWDNGNKKKNTLKHLVTNTECEEVFSNEPVFLPDNTHSQSEERYHAFGETDKGRLLLIAFTIRGLEKDTIRAISARDQSRKEEAYHLKHKKTQVRR